MLPPAPSFRDPAGRCCSFQGRVLRFVAADAVLEFEKFLQTGCAQKFVTQGKLVASRKLDEKEVARLQEAPELASIFAAKKIGAVFEHEKVSYPGYPHE